MTPRAGSGAAATTAPTWVFPFNRPLPPGTGDNRALAVNTTDGSVTYDVSFSLVWADGSTALNKNEAYAFASCTGCRTVAVAFQVVLVAGQVDVVVPQNLSGALNYACVRCVTQALATQLVVSVPGALTDAQNAQLAAVWKDLQAFGAHIQDVPLAELRDRLTEFEARILDVVRPAATGAPESSASSTSSATGSAGPTDAPAATSGSSSASRPSAGSSETVSPTSGAATSAGPTSEAPAESTAAESAAATSPSA
jgi:putative peptide zinc metalloprotease protein